MAVSRWRRPVHNSPAHFGDPSPPEVAARVRNQFAVQCEGEFRSMIADGRRGGLIDTVGMALHRDRQAERSLVPIQKSVAKIQRNALPR